MAEIGEKWGNWEIGELILADRDMGR